MTEAPIGADRGVALNLNHVRRTFGDLVVIDDLTLDVASGEFLAILGPSGCGKSTLLRVVAGLDLPNGGTLYINPSDAKFHTAFVFQDAHLLPWLTVLENAALPLELTGVDRGESLTRTRRVLAEVELSDAESRYPSQLSGGMRMRVSLARALVTEPRLLLLDEPFAALDAQTREFMQRELLRIWGETRKTALFITHDIKEAVYLADRVLVFTRRPGRVKSCVEVDLPRPRELSIKRDARFLDYEDRIWTSIEEEVRASA
jgi:NitT/TauT family transport system ATP-binding protein